MTNQEQTQFTMGSWIWWIGKVVDNQDSKKLGRCKVRIYGYHSDEIEDKDLPWATPVQPITSAALGGVGFSPTGLLKDSTVIGFFLDGETAQVPVMIGSLGGKPPEDGRTPGEVDTNRLARNEQIGQTIVRTKRKNLDKANVAGSTGGGWSEPPPPYAAEYPHNHVYQTVNDITIEVDDTPGATRYAIWHPSGSYVEMHHDGTVVSKAMSDAYTVVRGDGHVLIKGDAKINVQGDASILVERDAVTEIKGSESRVVHGNSSLTIHGNYRVGVGGNTIVITEGNETHLAKNIYLN